METEEKNIEQLLEEAERGFKTLLEEYLSKDATIERKKEIDAEMGRAIPKLKSIRAQFKEETEIKNAIPQA